MEYSADNYNSSSDSEHEIEQVEQFDQPEVAAGQQEERKRPVRLTRQE